MKNIKSIFLILTVIFAGSPALFGQHTHHAGPYNYLVITQKIEQLKPVSMTSAALAEEDGKDFGEFKVVLYGPEVVQLTDKKKMRSIIKTARKSHLKLAVCAMALDKMGVDHKKIPKAFEIVDNAFLHFNQLQKAGYISLSL